MTIDKDTEAKAPVKEDATDETKAAVTTEAKEGEEKPEAETEEAETSEVEGAEEVKEGEEKKPTKSALRREKQKAHIAALEESVKRLSEQLQSVERSKPVADALGPKPDRTKYEDDAEYAADLAAWKVEEKIIARQRQTYEQNSRAATSDTAAKKVELFFERIRAVEDRFPGLEKAIRDDSLPVSQAMRDTLIESDKGPEVAHYLATHPEDARRIKEMPPLAAARELGRIEATIDLPPSRKETKAPPPPTTLRGTGGSVNRKTTDASGDELSAEEWARRERARLAAKRSA